jgi:hypothetical protein
MEPRAWQNRAVVAGGLAAVALVFWGPLLTGKVYYGGDIARIYLPLRAALGEALRQGGFPWWTTHIGAGYPLVAAGEAGALYPPNILLALIPSPALSLTLTIVSHYALAAAGWHLWSRALGRSAAAAWLGAAVWTLGGFNVAHASHVSVLTTAAWLPWMLWFVTRLDRALTQGHRWIGPSAGLAAAIALQFLAGHAQMYLLNLGVVCAYLLWRALGARRATRQVVALLGCALVALLLGVILAAPQLLTSAQLGALSTRSGGLDESFFTSFSFHPLLGATLISPFLLGNPYPQGSVELMAYSGLLPLLLASFTLRTKRSGEEWFWVGVGLAGFLLALGRWNPLYGLMRQLPIVNLFRVPARYLYWLCLALAVLAGRGLDALVERCVTRSTTRGRLLAGGSVLLALAVVGVALGRSDADALVAAWQWLPLLLLAAGVGLMVAAGSLSRRVLAAVALLVLLGDLWTFGRVLTFTYSAMEPIAEVEKPLTATAWLRSVAPGVYRTYTKEQILPQLSVQRESLYPNMGLWQGIDSANVYLPLVPEAYQRYLDGLSPERLNRLGIKYYIIPQLLPVDAASELYDVENPFAGLPTGEWLSFRVADVVAVEVESYLSHAAALPDGELAATVVLQTGAGERGLPLRVGLETAEWAYERDDVRQVIAHQMPRVATTFPARSGFPTRDHPGHTYLARWALTGAPEVTGMFLELALPSAFTRIERVWLVTADGQAVLVNHLAGQANQVIAYRSEDALIFRNEDAWPRAFTLREDQVAVEGDALTIAAGLGVESLGRADLFSYASGKAVLIATLDAPGYLVLADQAYPGWQVTVDGTAAEVLTVDSIYRGVHLGAGRHTIVFWYRPLDL